MTRHARAWLLGTIVLVAAVVAGACSSARPERPLASEALGAAVTLARADARLGEALRARGPGEAFAADDDGWTSPGLRGGPERRADDLGARAPARADGALEAGVGTLASRRVRLTPRGAAPVGGELLDGRVVYPGAFGRDVDLLVTTDRTSVETLLVLREPNDAPRARADLGRVTFTWDVELPQGIAGVEAQRDGGLALVDARGERVLVVPPAYAVDARGERREAQLAWDGAARTLGVELDARGLAYPVLLDPAFGTPVWEQQTAPAGRWVTSLAYDAVRGKVVVFGGTDSLGHAGSLGDTWTWDGSWTASAAPGPTARTYHAMTYDAARGNVVLFGGGGWFSGAEVNDTWTWDGKLWTKQSPAAFPTARSRHALAYDAARGRVVLFGGSDGANALGDTWTWDGATWAQLAPAASPPARSGHAMTYDAARGRIVLFGGTDGTNALGDTWTWDGATWAEVSPAASPPPRSLHAMAYDAARAKVVLFGGSTASALGDTWTWDGAAWSQENPASAPSARSGHGMTYDDARGRVVLFAGSASADETWEWDGATWSKPPGLGMVVRQWSAAAYDEARAKVVLFGGKSGSVPLSDTRLWDGKGFALATVATPPPGRWAHAMAYDAARARVVLFGGGGNGLLADTWTWDGATWTQAAPATSPPARMWSAMAYDAARAEVVLFGGYDTAGTILSDTWTWDGTTWTQRAVTGPTARLAHAMAYHPGTGKVILHGGMAGFNMYGGTGPLADTWTWNGTAWSAAAAGPAARGYHGMAYDALLGSVVLAGGTLSPFTTTATATNAANYGDTWTFDGATWTQRVASGFVGRAGFAFAYDGARQRVLLHGGFRSVNALADTWLFYTRGGACSKGADCTSGFCVDGVCCQSASCGSCEACNLAASPGVCAPITSAPDPDTCTSGRTCNASGVCVADLGGACTANAQCASGYCVDGSCCNVSSCDSASYCNGACVPRKAYGAACAQASECLGGASCADGVCCNAACTGQCEACDLPGTVGTCAPSTGPARSGRPACASGGANVCAAAACDGVARDHCAGLAGSAVSCRAASCVDGVATFAASCTGQGRCADLATKVCAPFACGADACKERCASDADCAPGNACDAATQACVARATCDGDHTLTGASGDKTDCAPFRCDAKGCLTTCGGVQDCVFPASCDANGRCVAAPAAPPAASAGCAVATAGRAGLAEGWPITALGALGALLGLRRHRRRGPRRARAATRWALVAIALAASVASGCSTEPQATGQPRGGLEEAVSLARGDAKLGAALAPRAPSEGLTIDGAFYTSPGWRRAGAEDVGARLPSRADGALEVGVGQLAATRLRLAPRGASPVAGVLSAGRAVYEGAYGPGTDLVVAASRTAVEQLFVLHEATPSAAFAWDVTLPSGIARGAAQPDGGLRFLDVGGAPVLIVPAAFAVDARGARRAARLAWSDATRTLAVELDARGLTFPVLLDPAFELGVWSPEAVRPPPGSVYVAEDTARGKMVFLTGASTLLWDGRAFAYAPVTSPPPRGGGAMTYDATRGKVLFFGGFSNTFLNDTWTWDGASWSQIVPPVSPPPTESAALAYDGAHGRAVLFGGTQLVGKTGSTSSDTWTWDGATWTKASPSASPPARSSAAMVYDAAHGKLVLFGGAGTGSGTLGDTWLWDGATWTQAPAGATPPTARLGHAMTYDAALGKVVLFGGHDAAGAVLGDTWTWDGADWSQQASPSAPPRYFHTLAYDTPRARVVLFGGTSSAGTSQNDLWTWAGGDWAEIPLPSTPGARSGHAMAFDAARSNVLLFGGAVKGTSLFLMGSNDTWTWDGASWTQANPPLSPPPRNDHAMAYDAARGKVVLFGGSYSYPMADTWTWDGATWQPSTATGPSARVGHAMVYDPAHGNVVLFGGGQNGGRGQSDDTWLWDGSVWTQAFPVSSPPARCYHAMAYDGAHVILFGGWATNGVNLSDTWAWDGSKWTQVAAGGPQARNSHAMVHDEVRGKVLLFSGTVSGAIASDVWTWDGTSWTQDALSSPPAARSGHAMAYDAARSRVVVEGGTRAGVPNGAIITPLGDTWTYRTHGGSCTRGSECDTGFCVDGVCCESASCGTCQACNLATPGRCSPVTSAPDPDTCSGTRACDSTGACATAVGKPCATSSDCPKEGPSCVDGVCCTSACGGQCEACDVPGAEGFCTPVSGAPHARRAACPTGKGEVCTGTACDGVTRASCVAFVGAEVTCRATSCVDGVATFAAQCTGSGLCPALQTQTCAPYACGPSACKQTCTGDGDCAPGSRCHVDRGACVSETTCDGDHTLTDATGKQLDCGPYRCDVAGCIQACQSVKDCVFPASCDGAGKCVVADAGASSSAGCAVATGATDGRWGWGALVVVVGALARRRRARPTA